MRLTLGIGVGLLLAITTTAQVQSPADVENGRIAGSVVTTSSELVADVFRPVGVTVEAISIDYGDPAGTSSGTWIISDPGGLFTLSGIAPGLLTLLAYADSDQGR